MTAAAFRKLALRLPEATEREHMGHPDFRVKGKIFATLGYPGAGWAAVMLTPEDQDSFVRMQPGAFSPVTGRWGEQGATKIELRRATAAVVKAALSAAHEARVVRARKRA